LWWHSLLALPKLRQLGFGLGDRPQILPGHPGLNALAQIISIESNPAAEHIGAHFHQLIMPSPARAAMSQIKLAKICAPSAAGRFADPLVV
jgi:hypothetical protein